MNYEEALKEIAKQYKVRRMYEKYAQIETHEFFDGYNFIFIGVREYEGKVLLTDNAEYAELVDYDTYYDEIVELAKKHDVIIDDYHIEKDYTNNDDVKAYFEFLYELRDNYSNEVLQEKETQKFLALSNQSQMEIVKKYVLKNSSIMTSKMQMDLWPLTRKELEDILDKLVKEGYLIKQDDDYFIIN